MNSLKLTIFRIFIFLILLSVFVSCMPKHQERSDLKAENIALKYAKLFKIDTCKEYIKISIRNKPETEFIYTFYLLKKEQDFERFTENETAIKTPVKRVICLSTTHISFINLLDETKSIVGLSGTEYVNNHKVKQRISGKNILDIGYEQNINIELLMSLKPDVVFAYNVENNMSSIVEKAKKLNIPFVMINEYMEPEILGQTEWLKVFGYFFEKTEQANRIFNKISSNYNKIKQLTDTIQKRPTIVANMPWQGTWYIPGGRSNVAKLISDAGGKYLWENDENKHNIYLSLEEVYSVAQNAEIWINPGQANSMNDILSTDKRLVGFDAFTKKSIYNCNAIVNENGGNEYMESGPVCPDIILQDLIKILHPDLLPEYKLHYYKKME